jgi:hypothetical protein
MWLRDPAIALILVMLLLPLVAVSAPAVTHSGGENVGTGLIVPLYGQYGLPSGEWDQLIQAKAAYPQIPIVAIVNAANGSGNAKDDGYAAAIRKVQAAHILVIGYVYTSLAQKPLADVRQDVANYKAWYGVDGIYFDQMSEVAGNESYYANATQYAKSLGMVMTVGNPGTYIALSYVGTVDTLVIYERPQLPTLAYLASWLKSGDARSNFAFIAFGVPDFNQTYAKAAAASVGFMFMTDAKNYFVMPSYLSKELALLQSQLGPTSTGAGAWSPALIPARSQASTADGSEDERRPAQSFLLPEASRSSFRIPSGFLDFVKAEETPQPSAPSSSAFWTSPALLIPAPTRRRTSGVTLLTKSVIWEGLAVETEIPLPTSSGGS